MNRRYVIWMIVAVVSGAAIATITRNREPRRASAGLGEEVDPSLERLNGELARRRGATPPAPVRLTPAKAIVENPTSFDYDPVLLSAIRELPVRDIYGAEPRNDEFAVEREAAITAILGADLAEFFPDAVIRAVDCRTSSCVVTIDGPAVQWKQIYSLIQHPSLGLVQNPGHAPTDDPSVVEVSLGILFSKDLRDHTTYAEWYRKNRAEQLPALRELGLWPPRAE